MRVGHMGRMNGTDEGDRLVYKQKREMRTSRSFLLAASISCFAASSSFLISWRATTRSDAGINCDAWNPAFAAFAMVKAGFEPLADIFIFLRYEGLSPLEYNVHSVVVAEWKVDP